MSVRPNDIALCLVRHVQLLLSGDTANRPSVTAVATHSSRLFPRTRVTRLSGLQAFQTNVAATASVMYYQRPDRRTRSQSMTA